MNVNYSSTNIKLFQIKLEKKKIDKNKSQKYSFSLNLVPKLIYSIINIKTIIFQKY